MALLALLLVLGAVFAIFAAENGADSRELYADSYNLPHTNGLN